MAPELKYGVDRGSSSVTAEQQLEAQRGGVAPAPRALRDAKTWANCWAPTAMPGKIHQVRGERRGSQRYPIDLAVRYEFRLADGRPCTGAGRVVNISSGGVLVRAEEPVPQGLRLRVKIQWPARLNDAVPLLLHVEGQAVRSDKNLVAIKILRSEFRTRPSIAQAGVARQAG